MSVETGGAHEQQPVGRSVGARVLSWLAAVIVLAIVLLAFMHVFAPAIGREEEPPSGHWQSSCIACHLVTSGSGAETP